jgi:hypothetical protein
MENLKRLVPICNKRRFEEFFDDSFASNIFDAGQAPLISVSLSQIGKTHQKQGWQLAVQN